MHLSTSGSAALSCCASGCSAFSNEENFVPSYRFAEATGVIRRRVRPLQGGAAPAAADAPKAEGTLLSSHHLLLSLHTSSTSSLTPPPPLSLHTPSPPLSSHLFASPLFTAPASIEKATEGLSIN